MKLEVGIDLGTTNSVISYFENGSIQYLKFRNNDSLASVLLYQNKKITIGEIAKRKAAVYPANFIKSSKTFMGNNGKTWSIEDKEFSPTDVATEILKEARKELLKKFPDLIEAHAVITIPAYFKSTQIDETKKAGENAGFIVKQIITEPVAAAIAYGFESEVNQKLFIVDIGGGTFDTAILEVHNGELNTLAIEGDNNLGGDDFDKHLLNFMLKFIRKDNGVNLVSHEKSGLPEDEYRKAIQALTNKSEEIKIELSEYLKTDIEIPNLFSGYNLSTTITRKEFEDISSISIEKIKREIEKTLEGINYTSSHIDKVVLVGGSARIPIIREYVLSIFEKNPYSDKPLDKLVAIGALLLAHEDNTVQIKDIISHSLGIEVLGDTGNLELQKMLLKNDHYPCSFEKTFTTTEDFQEGVNISVFEGEFVEDINRNEFYGEFTLDNIEKAQAGIPQIKVTFNFDKNRILTVIAEDLMTKSKKEVSIVKCTESERSITNSNSSNSTLKLSTGDSANLSMLGYDLANLKTVLSWDANTGSGNDYDLDSSLITLCDNNIIETVSFENLRNPNASIVHHGDNLTGEGAAEEIDIDLYALPSNINRLVFIVNIYECSSRNQHFGIVDNIKVSIIDSKTKKVLLQYDVGENNKNKTAMYIAEIKKENDMWVFKALGKPNNCISIEELENDIIYLHKENS